jgi:hypothetical protein
MRLLMPSIDRSSSVNRTGPRAAATMIRMLHLPATRSSTSRTGHASTTISSGASVFICGMEGLLPPASMVPAG